MRCFRIWCWLSFLALCGLSASDPALAAAPPLQVIASFSVLGDLVQQVGGDKVAVTLLVGPNQDAHAFEPTPRQVKAIGKADLVVVNGLGFEGWQDRLIRNAGYRGKIVVASAGVVPLELKDAHHDHHHDSEHDSGAQVDPHAWHDLGNAARYLTNIEQALVAKDPGNADLYRNRAESYRQQLSATAVWAKAQFEGLPASARRAITNHDAFQYFARAYELQFQAPMGWTTEVDPAAKDLKNLIQQMRDGGVRVLFLENVSNPRLLNQIAREGGGVIGGKLYSDALDAPNTPAGSYLGMVRSNVEVVAKALRAP